MPFSQQNDALCGQYDKHVIVHGNSACSAGEAAGAGATGLVHIRVQEGGAIDAPKQLKEGLTEQQCHDLIAKCDAQPVCPCNCSAS